MYARNDFFVTLTSPIWISFLKTPHIFVQNDQRHEGIILRYVCWNTWDPSPAPSPPTQGLMPYCGVHYLWFAFVCFLVRSPPPPSKDPHPHRAQIVEGGGGRV